MNLKLTTVILSVLLALITIFIGVKQPTLHKQAMFSDEYHEFVEEELPTSNIGLENLEVPATRNIIAEPVRPQKTQVKQQYMPQQPQKQTNVVQKTTTVNKPKQTQSTVTTPVVQTTIPTAKPVVEEQKVEVQPQTKPRELTESEETIAWNRWRSNLQNQVMRDSHISAPIGTVFKFSFTVDKYGNMSNIKVWSTNPNYTNLATRVIKPVLSSYSHKPILNFPLGTKRVITNVNGGFVISTTTQYSKPSDYSDYEKVKRYN